MKKIMISLILLTLFCKGKGQTPANDPHWWLIKNEEFNSNNLWPFWEIENNRYYGGQDNSEAQVYINSNVSVVNGKLIITTKRENILFEGKTFHYTSGRIFSHSEYKYGYFEIKATPPVGTGFWPAIWLFSGKGNDCTYREVDLYEGDGNRIKYTSNNAYTQFPENCNSLPAYTITSNGWNSDDNGYIHPTAINGGEHIWALEWSPTFLIYYLDGVELRRISGNGFDRAMGIILNMALFNWTADKMPGVVQVNNNTTMPKTFEVDYVKVYKLTTTDCGTDVTYNTLNTSTTYNNVKRNITISGTSPIAVPANSTIILRAANEITINGDFSVPLGSEFGALISACN